MNSKKSLILFDLDGTLAYSTCKIPIELKTLLFELKSKYDLGLVGGSAFPQHEFQIDEEHIHKLFDWVFSENGTQAYHQGTQIHNNSIREEVPEETLQQIINKCLRYIADLDLPKKRGKFIDFRNGLMYITPMGSNCTREERIEFIGFDSEHNIRGKMIKELEKDFGEDFCIKLGGQIGLGIYPKGWDKTYCLKHLNLNDYEQVYFFGDQTNPDGNDYCLYSHPQITGYSVDSPDETFKILVNEFCTV